VVFLGGAPGSGKGTNSAYIAKLRKFSAPTIVVSDLLNTPACKLLKDNGIMINDEFVYEALLMELQKPIYRDGVVVDGFPRTEAQVGYINQFYKDQSATSLFLAPATRLLFVMLHVDEAESISRQQERGQKMMLHNAYNNSVGKSEVEVRQTDIDIAASKARYPMNTLLM
jgi:adenylate kinase